MRETIFGVVFVTSLILNSINCQPEWQTPTDGSTHSFDKETKCVPRMNVLQTNLDAKSTNGDTVHYRIVTQSPNDGAFVYGDDIASEPSILCTSKDNLKSPQYDVVIGTYYEPRTAQNEASITVKLVVEGLAEPTPLVFIKPNPDSSKNDHVINIPESIQPGDDVLKLEATDGNDSTGSTFTFNIDNSSVSTSQLFEIKEGTDMLKVRSNVTKDYFDAENMDTESTYPIVLQVSYGEKVTSLSTQIHVLDVNDNSPEFSGNLQASIPVNSAAGYTVLTLTVTDKDRTSPNNQVTLSLLGADEFEINGTDIVVAQGANFTSHIRKYLLTVNATDNAEKNSKSAREIIIVNIYGDKSGAANRDADMMIAAFMAFFVCLYNYW